MPTLKKVKGLIPRLRTPGGIVVERRPPPVASVYHDYDLAAPVLVVIPICVVHVLSGRDLEQVPDANYNRETIQVYTAQRLYVADEGKDADVVLYRGRRYTVIQVQDYFLQGGVYISAASLEDLQNG